jgi:hypothetical protein
LIPIKTEGCNTRKRLIFPVQAASRKGTLPLGIVVRGLWKEEIA